MKNNPKVSIIVPIYNVEKYLRKCLDSLVNQTLKDIEIICIDDCSPDNSVQIIKEYAINDTRIKHIFNTTNLGLSQSRNEGVRIAKGEYVAFVDSDDWVEINMYEDMYNVAVISNSDVVGCDYALEYENKESESIVIPDNAKVSSDYVLRECICYTNLTFMATSSCTKIYKREIVSLFSFLNRDEYHLEDRIFNISVLLTDVKVSWCNQLLYHYLQRSSSFQHVYKPGLLTRIIKTHAYINSLIMEQRDRSEDYIGLNNKNLFYETFGMLYNALSSKLTIFKRIKEVVSIVTNPYLAKHIGYFKIANIPSSSGGLLKQFLKVFFFGIIKVNYKLRMCFH